MILRVVECPEPLMVEATGRVRHLCPFVDEADSGLATVRWSTDRGTVELHSLAAYLDSFAEKKISHEELADTVRTDVLTALGGGSVEVLIAFETAGLSCQVTSA